MPAEAPTLESVAQAVSELSTAVEESRGEQYDRDKIQAIVTELMEAQRDADTELNRRNGYQPEDREAENDVERGTLRAATREERFEKILQRDAAKVAPLVRHSESTVREFQARADELLIVSAAMGVNPRETDLFHEEYAPLARALDTQTAAEGQEYVPTALSSDLIERVNLDLRVVALFPSVVMPTPTFEIPGRGVSRQRLGNHPEQTADTGQTKVKVVTPATRKITLAAKKFAGEMITSKEAEEDAIIAMLPFMQEELVDYLSFDLEDTALNGDTAAAQDSDFAAVDPRRNWNGLRKLALAAAKTDGSNAVPTVAMSRVSRKKMGKYGVRIGNLVHITSMSAYVQLLSDVNVITVDKYGPNATILAGELGKIDGIPIVVSEAVRQDLNATGVYDGVTTNRTETLTVNTKGYVVGERRGLTVQVLRELYAESDQDAIMVTTRKAFSPRFPSATEPTVSLTYNQAA